MRTSNPALSESTFYSVPQSLEQPMTMRGTVMKTSLLTMLVVGAGIFSWNTCLAQPNSAGLLMGVGAVTGFVICLLTIWKKHWSPVTAPLYAIAEGVFLGALSLMYNLQFNGIVLQAIMLTVAVLVGLLAAYQMNLIKATENLRLGLFAATAGIALVYLVTIVLGFFGIQIPYIHGSGLIGIGFSLFAVTIAALNLVLDFDFIENGVQARAPRFMEWYAAFGLMVTLIWLYVEILRLLAKLNSRR
jgi:uncharacterized YccA/Bax inhibitor family protein